MNNFARLAVLTYRGAFVSWQGPGYVTRIFFQPLLHVLTVVLAGKFAGSPQAAEHYTIGLLAFSIIFVIAYRNSGSAILRPSLRHPVDNVPVTG